MTNRTSDCLLLVMLALAVLFFVSFKIMINSYLDELNEYKMEQQLREIIEVTPNCYETRA